MVGHTTFYRRITVRIRARVLCNAAKAQLVVQMICNHQVVGSSPTCGSFGVLVQLVRIHACHAWGHGFESRTYRNVYTQVSANW